MQLWVCQQQECDFIAWTPNWMFCVTVQIDNDFITNALKVLNIFYKQHVIPELLTRNIELKNTIVGPNESNKNYCFCQKPYNEKDGIMIGCDSDKCANEWFHLDCVKLKRIPKRKWYCSSCRKQKNKENKQPKL